MTSAPLGFGGTPADPRRSRRQQHAAHWRSLGVLRRALLALSAALVAVLVVSAVSFTRAMTDPGGGPVVVRAVDWLRSVGAGGVVNGLENWWYRSCGSQNPPSTSDLPRTNGSGAFAGAGPAPLTALAGPAALPGEGVWVPGARGPGGVALATTFVRPIPDRAGTVVGVVWLNQNLTATTLIAGTREPGGAGWPGGAQVPASMLPSLLATVNSGYRMADAHGGFYLDGRTAQPLRDGAASLVVHRDGTVAVGQWGRDAAAGPTVVAVRQNLDLVVDHGAAVPGLDRNDQEQWGSTGSQFQCTWRSGIGQDATGNLRYVAGNHLTLTGLATAMRAAGIVRGMQLDIHPTMVSCTTYRPDLPGTAPAALLPGLSDPASTGADGSIFSSINGSTPGGLTSGQSRGPRYLTPDRRDFFAVTLRPDERNHT